MNTIEFLLTNRAVLIALGSITVGPLLVLGSMVVIALQQRITDHDLPDLTDPLADARQALEERKKELDVLELELGIAEDLNYVSVTDLPERVERKRREIWLAEEAVEQANLF